MKAGWKLKKLGDVCEIIKGRKPQLKQIKSEDDLPYLMAKFMRGSKDAEYASIKDRNSILVSKDETIIICDGSNSGEVFTGFHGILSSTMGKIRKRIDINDEYLRIFLFSTFNIFNGSKTGSAIPHLDKAAMYSLSIPIPPLTEQRRIVAILNEAFADIAAAKEKAEQNLKNAKEVFSSSQRRIFSIVEEEYKCNELGKIAEFRNGVNFTKNSKGEIVKIIGVKDFKNNFFVPDENIDSVVMDGTIGEIDLLKNNDILTVRSNGNQELIGRCMIACNINKKTTHSGFTIRIRPKADFVNPTYLCTYLKSDTIRKKLVGEGTGVNIKSLNQKSLSSLAVPIPNLLKQQQIVSQIDSISAETSLLESIYQQKLDHLEELKKSLLQQAFSGAL